MITFLSATLLLIVAFALVFLLARKLDNYGVVDIAWSYAFGFVAMFYAAMLAGWPARRFVLAVIVVGWSARLGTHLYVRVMGHHPEEDGRYKEMRERWKANFGWEMFKFYQIQAVSVVVLAAPFFLAMRNPAEGFYWLEWVAMGLFGISLGGEALADAQLNAFKRDSENKGRVCEAGLWGYSRHPNYFFEWMIWVSFALFALASPWGWIGLLAPAAILYLLLRVTGIPLTEEQSVRSRGDAYRDYQKRVNAFVPGKPRRVN